MSHAARVLDEETNPEFRVPADFRTPAGTWDVIVVGGGPAGLSAALMLVRACRRVLVVDAGKQRNLVSQHVHGFFSRDGTPPLELLSIARAQLLSFRTAKLVTDTVTACSKAASGYEISTASGFSAKCHAVLLAQGVSDVLPAIKGLREIYGKQAHHCPFCDAWQHRGGKFVVYGHTEEAAEMAWELRGWSKDVTLVYDGEDKFSSACDEKLRSSEVKVFNVRPVEVRQAADGPHTLICSGGESIPFDAFFFRTEESRPLELVSSLGCRLENGQPCLSSDMETSVPGVFVAGNASPGHDMVAMAVAQGASAAIGIQEYLLKLGRYYEAPSEGGKTLVGDVALPMEGQERPIKAGSYAWHKTPNGGPSDSAAYARVKVLRCTGVSAEIEGERKVRRTVRRQELKPVLDFLVAGRMLPETDGETLDSLEELLVVLRTSPGAPEKRALHRAQCGLIENILQRNQRALPEGATINTQQNP